MYGNNCVNKNNFMQHDTAIAINKNSCVCIMLKKYLIKFSINIIDSRLLKMLRLARSELSVDDERKLTNSEKLLYRKLSELIKVWRAFFLSFD